MLSSSSLLRNRVAQGLTAVVVLSLAGVVLVRVLSSEHQPRPADASWPGLVEPTLAADDQGGQLLFARRNAPDLAAEERFGQIVVARLAAGSTRWSGVRPLSSQTDTAGLAADAAGHGRAIAAWTAGGVAWTRTLRPDGSWSPEMRLSSGTGVRFVSADVNRAGDELVAWREGARVALAWRPAEGEWRRWLGPATDQRPAAALGERIAGRASARVVWLAGRGKDTSIRVHGVTFDEDVEQVFDRELLQQPDVRSFGWDAAAEGQTLAIVSKTPDDRAGNGGTTSSITTYDALFGDPLTSRWTQDSASPNPAPVVDMTGGAARVTWVSYSLSSDRLDAIGTFWTRAGQDGIWGEGTRFTRPVPNATLRSVAARIDAGGGGLATYRTDDGGGSTSGTVLRLPFERAEPIFLDTLPTRGPVAIGVGLRGRIAVSWASGTGEDPVLHARVLVR